MSAQKTGGIMSPQCTCVCVRTRVRMCVCVSVAIWLRTYGFFSGLGAAMPNCRHVQDCWVRFTRFVLKVKAPRRRGGMNRRITNRDNQVTNQCIVDAVTAFKNNKEESGGALEED